MCPLCGAPATFDETSVQLYKYEPEEITMMGYDLSHLRIVAELLKSHNVTPADLREAKFNLETAMSIVRAEHEKMLQHMLEEALSRFQTPPIRLDGFTWREIVKGADT
jgi:hypothetical protein